MAFNFSHKKSSSESERLNDNPDKDYEFTKAINLFTIQREKVGISLEELSNKTKISRNVLIAIENGWKKYIPEKTYLISMLKILEIELSLERGSLKGLLDQKKSNNNLSNFKFINIDFLNSWFGSLLYFIFMLLSILALNSQQKYLLKINSVSTEPITVNDNYMNGENKINRKE
tara:strand:+ start:29 stop:550 length:522 start_codon:yes stop_codon:yes gene_type:complete